MSCMISCGVLPCCCFWLKNVAYQQLGAAVPKLAAATALAAVSAAAAGPWLQPAEPDYEVVLLV